MSETKIPSGLADTTTSFKQAEDWVKRKLNANSPIGYVNVYELDEDLVKSLKTLLFESPTEDWLDFVMSNRTNKDFNHDFDIVYGPVANDKVYAAFALYEGGIIDKQNLISELKAYKLVDQYLFHTDKALKAIKFIEAKEVTI